MKRLATILFLLCALRAKAFVFTNEFDATINWTSYGSPQFSAPSYVLGSSYIGAGISCFNVQFTNHFYTLGQGGSAWGADNTNNLERAYAPWWASYPVPGYNLWLANANGGYGTSNAVFILGTNIANAPALTFNGTAYTNEAIPTQPIIHLFEGNPLEGIDFSPSNRNDGSLGLNRFYGTQTFDLYHELLTNGTGVNDATNFYAGGHPVPSLSLLWAMWFIHDLGVDTNVGSVTLDWRSISAITNHSTASGITVSNNILTVSALRFDRMPPLAWDVPDGMITNDASGALAMVPMFANYWKWAIQVLNMPSGVCTVNIDGSNVVTLTSSQLAAGWNMFAVTNGPFWAQRKEVLGRNRDQMGCDRVTLIEHSAGGSGTIVGKADMANWGSATVTPYTTNGKRGTNYLAAIQTYTDQVRTNYDVAIQQAAKQTNHTLIITLAPYALTASATVSAVTNALNAPVILDASGSTNAASYLWTQTNGAALDMIGRDQPKPMLISVTNAGTYGFQLVVSDGTSFATNGCTVTFVSPTGGHTNYVDSTLPGNTTTYSIANRNSSGTDGNCYTNIQGGANVTGPSDLLLIRGGNPYTNTSIANQILVNITNSLGSATAPIRIENYPGEHVTLGGWGFSDADTNSDGLADGPTNSGLRQTLFFIQTNANYIQVKGLEMTNSEQGGMTLEASFCYVQQCSFHDNWTDGAQVLRAQLATNSLVGTVFRWNEAHHNRHFNGFTIGLENLSTFGFIQDCAMVENISYFNGYTPAGPRVLPYGNDPQGGGNSGGFLSTKFLDDNARFNPQYGVRNWGPNLYFVRNVSWNNCDDGFAFDHASSLIEDNRSLFNGPTGAMGYKMLRYVQDLSFRGNIAFGNLLRGFELRVDTNSFIKVYNNTSSKNQEYGFWIASQDASSAFILTNNVAAFDGLTDWNLTGFSNNWAADGANVALAFRGNPLFVNTNLASISTAAFASETVPQRWADANAQVVAAMAPATNSPLKGVGFFIANYSSNANPDFGALRVTTNMVVAPPPIKFFKGMRR